MLCFFPVGEAEVESKIVRLRPGGSGCRTDTVFPLEIPSLHGWAGLFPKRLLSLITKWVEREPALLAVETTKGTAEGRRQVPQGKT
jgi:hypothetical protein